MNRSCGNFSANGTAGKVGIIITVLLGYYTTAFYRLLSEVESSESMASGMPIDTVKEITTFPKVRIGLHAAFETIEERRGSESGLE